ncbi:MAG TPA: PAS domain-containing protein [Alphaproteobacteria bacterium]|nr:PAS domain-containing protein [Alphaproteobacteria bacterium]
MTTTPNAVAIVLAALASPALREIVAHWNAVRGDRMMPAWEDIDPLMIKRHLPIVWSWKYDRGSDSFTGRLAGETINAIFGKSLRNAKMEEFFAGWNYPAIFARHRRVICEPCIAVGKGLVFVHAERYGVGERVILPLAKDGLHGDGLIGATVYEWGKADVSAASEMVENITYYPLSAPPDVGT